MVMLIKVYQKVKEETTKEDFFNEIRKREYYETRNERKRKEKDHLVQDDDKYKKIRKNEKPLEV